MPCQSASNTPDWPRQGLLVLMLVAVIGLTLVGLAFLYLDQAVVDCEKQWTGHPLCASAILGVTWLGNWQLGPLVIAVMLIVGRHHWRRLLGTIAVAYLLRTGAVEWLKLSIGRPRPRDVADASVFDGFASGASFPSGHASFAFMLAAIIAAWFPRARWPAWITAILVASGRVLVHAHFVSDVIAGALVGTLAGMVVLSVLPPPGDASDPAAEQPSSPPRETPRRSPPAASRSESAERRRALMVLTIVLWIAATLMAYWYIDPLPHLFENGFFEQPSVKLLATVGRHLGTWPLAPLLVAIVLIAATGRWKRLLVTVFIGFVIQTALTEGIKWLAGRPRPWQMPDPEAFYGPSTEYHSFPSGHASFIFVFATICGHYFPRWRAGFYALATFVAASRVVLGAHYVSDVAFGALIGVLSGWAVLALWPAQRGAAQTASDGGERLKPLGTAETQGGG